MVRIAYDLELFISTKFIHESFEPRKRAGNHMRARYFGAINGNRENKSS